MSHDNLYKHQLAAIARLPRRGPLGRSYGRGGWKLRAERVAAGLNQQDVAQRLGIPAALLSMIEHERIRLPRGFMREYREALCDH